MGARDFYFTGEGLNAKSVYNDFVEREIEEYGRSSGFASKGGIQQVNLPANIKTKKQVEQYIDKIFNADNSPYCDKYAPAYYVVLPNTGKKEFDEVVGATVKKTPSKGGTKQWKTVYQLSYYGDYDILKTVDYDTQARALEEAKKLAEKGKTVELSVEEKLLSGSKQIAVIEPKKKKVKKVVNTYFFFGFVRE